MVSARELREAFRRAEQGVAEAIRVGHCYDPADMERLRRYPDGLLVIETLERLANIAVTPVVRSMLRVDALETRVKYEAWAQFETQARKAWRGLRGFGRATFPPNRPHSLIWKNSEEIGVDVRRSHARDIAVAYGRFLRKTGRPRMAARVFGRLIRSNSGLGMHLAHTEMGLLRLEAGDHEAAAFHFVESLNVPDDMWLHKFGYSRELLNALDASGVATPEVLATKKRILRARIPV